MCCRLIGPVMLAECSGIMDLVIRHFCEAYPGCHDIVQIEASSGSFDLFLKHAALIQCMKWHMGTH